MLHDGSKSQETKVVDLKRETDKSTMKVGDFKALLSLQNTEALPSKTGNHSNLARVLIRQHAWAIKGEPCDSKSWRVFFV